MSTESVVVGAQQFRREERAYLLLLALFAILAGVCVGYGLFYAFEYTDTSDASDLTRLLTSGFLFVFSGVAIVGLWLRWAYVVEGRRLIARMKQPQGE